MKNGKFTLIAALLSLYAFGDGRVTETTWHGAYDSGDYSDEGFVAKKTDSFDKKTYYWCCKDCGNGIEVTGFDVNENWGGSYVPCVYTGTWDGWPDSSQYVGYTYLHRGIIPLEVNGKPLVRIGLYAFVNCGFNSFDIPSTVTKIDSHAFQNCKKLLGLDLPSGLMEIGNEAFSGCVDLFDINIPATVAKVGENAFNGCEKLRSNGMILIDGCLVDAGSVSGAFTIPTGVRLVADAVFEGFNGLTSVTIPATVTSIGRRAFGACQGLLTIDFEGAPPTGAVDAAIKQDAVVRYNSQYANDWLPVIAQCGWSNASPYTPETATEPVDRKPDGGPYQETVAGIEWSYIVSNGEAYVGTGMWEPAIPVATTGEIVIPPVLGGCPVTRIEERAFWECSGLSSITIPPSVTSIGAESFWGCSGLTEVVIPPSVTSIGSSAFWCCFGLIEVTIPQSVTSIGDGAFSDCYSMTSLTISPNVTNIGECAFWGCGELTSVTIPSSVINIGDRAFGECGRLMSFSVDDSSQNYASINGLLCSKDGRNLLSGVNGVVTIPFGVENIEDYAFEGCDGLVALTIPQSVTNVGIDAFWGCSKLQVVFVDDAPQECVRQRLGDQIRYQKIGSPIDYEWTFSYEKKQATVTGVYPEVGVVSIPLVSNGAPVTRITDFAFRGCFGLTAVTIPFGVTNIGAGAFEGCSGLVAVTIPSSVTGVGECAFAFCSSLKTVTIDQGDADRVKLLLTSSGFDIQNISFVEMLLDGGPYTETIEDVTWTYRVRDRKAEVGFGSLPAIPLATEGQIKIPSILGGRPVTSVGENAFNGCVGLTAVAIPASVANIGKCAFAGCEKIGGVVVPSGVALKEVFPDANITSVAFADGVEYIESSCLAGLNLNSIVVPDSVESIEDNALSVGSAITFKGECPDNYIYSGVLGASSVTLPNKDSAAYKTYPKVSEVLGVYALKGLSGESTPMTQIEGELYFNTRDHVDSQCAEKIFKALSLSWIHRYYDHLGKLVTLTNALENASAALHTQFWSSSNYRFTLRNPWYTSRDDELCLMATSDRFVGSTLDDVPDYMIPWFKCEVAEVKNLGDADLNRGDIIAISAPDQSEVAILCDANEYPLDNYSSPDRWAAPADVGVALDGVYYWQIPDILALDKSNPEGYWPPIDFPQYQGDGDQFFTIDYIVCIGDTETRYEVQSCVDVAAVTFDTGCHSENGEVFKTYVSKAKTWAGEWHAFCMHEDPWFDDWIEVHEEKWPTYWKQQQCGVVTPEWDSWVSPETSMQWQGQQPPTHYEYHNAGWGVEPGWQFVGWRLVEGFWAYAPIECTDGDNYTYYPECQPTVRDAGLFGDSKFVAEYAPITNKIEYVDVKGCANNNPTNFTILDEIEFSRLSDPKGWHFVGWNPARIEAGTVGDVVVTGLWEVAISIPEAAGDVSRQWITYGDAEWCASWSDERSDWFVRSGEIGDSQLTTLETCVTNAGLVSFDLRVSCEDWYRGVKTDGVIVAVDDEVRLVQGVCDWTNVCLRIEGEGEHIITWSYTKDVEGCGREDCACLANFVFVEEATLRFEGQSFCSGEPPEQIVTLVGESVEIPGSNTLSYDKHHFVGWQNGEVIYRAGDVCEIESTMLTFTAVWEAKILASPSISVQSYYETEKTLVTIVGDGNGDVYYTLDGSIPTANSSRYVDAFEVAGTFTITAISLKDGWFESAAVVAKTQRAPWLIEECLNTTNLSFRTGGDAHWLRDLTLSHDGVASMRSGEISNNETSWIETTVEGSGVISFWWKGSTEKFRDTIFDVGTFEIDGEKKYEIGGETDWMFVTTKIDGSGSHALRWQYKKDIEDDPGLVGECDCVWLDEVTWTPDAVALTLDDLAEVFGDDSDVAKNITDETGLVAFNGFLKDCSINSASDLKPAQKQYAYQSFKLSEITTAPRLFEEEPVLKIDDLELTGGNLELTISLTAGSEAIELAYEKLAQKIRVGTSLDSIVAPPEINPRPSADGTSLTFTISKPEGNQGFVKVQID